MGAGRNRSFPAWGTRRFGFGFSFSLYGHSGAVGTEIGAAKGSRFGTRPGPCRDALGKLTESQEHPPLRAHSRLKLSPPTGLRGLPERPRSLARLSLGNSPRLAGGSKPLTGGIDPTAMLTVTPCRRLWSFGEVTANVTGFQFIVEVSHERSSI
jgi:hypothetical protein